MQTPSREEKITCDHDFEYKSEVIKLHNVNNGWFDAKRIIIFCKKCGLVSHDQTNSSSSYSQDYKHKI